MSQNSRKGFLWNILSLYIFLDINLLNAIVTYMWQTKSYPKRQHQNKQFNHYFYVFLFMKVIWQKKWPGVRGMAIRLYSGIQKVFNRYLHLTGIEQNKITFDSGSIPSVGTKIALWLYVSSNLFIKMKSLKVNFL